MTTKLKPYQLEGVQRIYSFRGRALLADEMGLGKTIQALYWIRKIPSRRPVVIVTPASIKYTWQSEAFLHFGMRTEVLEGFCRSARIKLPGDIIILNYDILKSWLKVLRKADPQCIIFDECQMIKDIRAKRTRAARKLAENAASVLGLSGTPIINRPIEFWPILNIICPDLFPDRVQFAWRYCAPKHTRWGWRFTGSARTGELNRILREECMIRRRKRDVLQELPNKIRKVVSLKLSSYKEYRKAEDDFIGWLKGISLARAARAKKNKALTRVGYLLRLCAALKLKWTERWIEEFFEAHPGECLVAFSMNTFVIDCLHKRFPRSVILDGRVKGRKRTETVRRFQSDRRIDLLLGNWKAAGVGITLHRASNAVGLDLPWTPGDLLQGEDRIHRIGQEKRCVVHYLVTIGTIEEKLIKILKKKAAILDAILDGGRTTKEVGIFDALMEEMQQ